MTPTVGRKSSTGRRVPPHTPMNSTSTTRPTTHPREHLAACPGSSRKRLTTTKHGQQHAKTARFSTCTKPPRPDSALRTTTYAPIIGTDPPIRRPGQSPHCGQLRLRQLWVLTNRIVIPPTKNSPGRTRFHVYGLCDSPQVGSGCGGCECGSARRNLQVMGAVCARVPSFPIMVEIRNGGPL